MKINIIQTITNTLTFDREPIRSKTVESYILYPDAGKQLHNKVTNEYFLTFATCNFKDKLEQFEEIDLPKED